MQHKKFIAINFQKIEKTIQVLVNAITWTVALKFLLSCLAQKSLMSINIKILLGFEYHYYVKTALAS